MSSTAAIHLLFLEGKRYSSSSEPDLAELVDTLSVEGSGDNERDLETPFAGLAFTSFWTLVRSCRGCSEACR